MTAEQIRAAYDALGLPPEEFDRTVRIVIDPDGVTVDLVELGPGGNVTRECTVTYARSSWSSPAWSRP